MAVLNSYIFSFLVHVKLISSVALINNELQRKINSVTLATCFLWSAIGLIILICKQSFKLSLLTSSPLQHCPSHTKIKSLQSQSHLVSKAAMQWRLLIDDLSSVSLHLLDHLNTKHWFHVRLQKFSNDFSWPRLSSQSAQFTVLPQSNRNMRYEPAESVLLVLECTQVEQQTTSTFLCNSLYWSPGKWWRNLRSTQSYFKNNIYSFSTHPYISIMNLNYSLAGQFTAVRGNKNPSSKPQLLLLLLP